MVPQWTYRPGSVSRQMSFMHPSLLLDSKQYHTWISCKKMLRPMVKTTCFFLHGITKQHQAWLSVLALCFIFLLSLKTELLSPKTDLSTLVQELKKLRDDLWYFSDHSQQRLDFISDKVKSMELRMDMTGGSTWDTLRHLKQHFEEFDPQAGGAALFTEFLVKKRWALLSGPVSHWDPEAQFTEWDLLLSTAILATREGVMYNRFLRVLEFMWFPFFWKRSMLLDVFS